ncbi:MAG: hypothetical protein KKC19_01900 [Nanoarchaeota archaeon]|nr:hypothetical protein [Nanoarchaeota archaeon]
MALTSGRMRDPIYGLSSMFDFIYTPGSMIRYLGGQPSESKVKRTIGNSIAMTGEVVRLGLYAGMSTLSPIVPIGFILTGLLGYLLKTSRKDDE